MLAKLWKKVLMFILIVACLFNVVIKLVNHLSLEKELLSSAQYIQDMQDAEAAKKEGEQKEENKDNNSNKANNTENNSQNKKENTTKNNTQNTTNATSTNKTTQKPDNVVVIK